MWNNRHALLKISNLLFLGAGLTLVYVSILFVLQLEIFSVRDVRVSGKLRYVTPQQIKTIVYHELNGSFFTLDLTSTKSTLEKLPWVRIAYLRREWPNRIVVSLWEHVAMARLSDAALINTYGDVFEAASDATLPMFISPLGYVKEVSQRYVEFHDQLKTLGRTPNQIKVSARGAWQIRLDNGVVIELGRKQIGQRMTRFVSAYPHVLAVAPHNANYFDLRYVSGFAVRVAAIGT